MPYSPPSIGSAGLTIPQYADYLNYLISQFLGIYGSACYLGPDSADYQDIAVRALAAANTCQALQGVYLSLNPQTAIGPSLDLCGALIGTPRKQSSSSTAVVTISGTPGTIIYSGLVRDTNSNGWVLPAIVTIGSGGTVNVTATAQVAGNITANAGTIIVISTPTAGWTGVTNAGAAVPGEAVEPDSAYRARLIVAQAKPSLTLLAGTAAAIAAVSGVTRSAVYENYTNTTDSNGNPAHSITCVVEGGSSAAIAQAIYANHGIGGDMNGTTTVTVTDPLNPAITMPVSFDILAYTPIYAGLTVHALAGYTTATTAAIIAGVVNYLESLGIGEAVVFSELYGAALTARPNPDQPLFSIHGIISGALAALTTATLTVSTNAVTVASGTGISMGQTIVGAGVPPNTTVTSITGTALVMSANATASGSGVPLSFFPTGTSDISIAFNYAASGASTDTVVTLV